MSVDITSITTGEGTTYVRPNHYSSGNTPFDNNLAYTYNKFYWTAPLTELFHNWMRNNSFFSFGNPMQMGTIKLDITTPLIVTGTQDIKRYSSSKVVQPNWTYRKEFTPTLDETNWFTTAGTWLKIKFDQPEEWVSSLAKVVYGWLYIMCYVHDAATVTQEPVMSDATQSVFSIEIDSNYTCASLYTAIWDDTIMEKTGLLSYKLHNNVFMDYAEFSVEPNVHLDIWDWTYKLRCLVWSARRPDNTIDYDSIFRVWSSAWWASVWYYWPDWHIGRYQYHKIIVENAVWSQYNSHSEVY